MREAVIASIVRTPIGSFGGSLAGFSAVDLGVIAAKEAIKRAGIDKDIIDEVLVGCVLNAGLGQNVARQIGIKSGLSESIPALTVGKVCASGLRSITMAAQFILAGDDDVVLAGGVESMSNAPYILNKARWGYRMGDGKIVDSMVYDGLTDVYNDYHMGITAENIAERWSITREEQDEFAYRSQIKAENAIKEGRFKDEIVPVMIPQKKGDPIVFDTDEYPRFGSTVAGFQKLKPAFKQGGTVTAGNASGINDGAAMCIVMSKEKADELNIKYIAKIKSYAACGVDPTIMGYGPVPATKKALKKANLTIDDIDLIEANEAFAAQSICVAKELGFNMDKVNVNGGAIALGHPIGASGARIVTTLLYEMKKRSSKYGLATLCVGGGMGASLIVEME